MHKHHIIPRHMGGTNDASNIVELTVKEHAEAHRILYEQHNNRKDFIAWKALDGQIDKEEIFIEKSSIGGHGNKGKEKSEEHRNKISKALTGITKPPLLEDTKRKISKTMLGNTNSKNHSTDAYKKKQSEAMKESHRKRKLRTVSSAG